MTTTEKTDFDLMDAIYYFRQELENKSLIENFLKNPEKGIVIEHEGLVMVIGAKDERG